MARSVKLCCNKMIFISPGKLFFSSGFNPLPFEDILFDPFVGLSEERGESLQSTLKEVNGSFQLETCDLS